MLKHRFNVFSQFGEDGIIEYLFDKINVNDGGTCCEFGAWDGKHLSNTFRLVKERNFRALYIEGDSVKYNDLLETCKEYPNITPHCEMVGHNLDEIFENTQFPLDIDLLSIDIDSIDYEVWQHAVKVNPKVVIIEANSQIPSWVKLPYTIEDGASYFCLEELGKEKGYTLVCNTSNLIFLRNDLVNDSIEIDDRIFPWHLEQNLKKLVFYMYDPCVKAVLSEMPIEIKNEFYKYRGGFELGYLGEEVRGAPQH
jgi:hypothetical protein